MTTRAGEGIPGHPWGSDDVAFNRWLCVSRIRACVALAVFFPLLGGLGYAQVSSGPVIAIAGALVVFSLVCMRSRAFLEHPRLFLWIQLLLDMAGITAGIGFATTGEVALMARPIYVVAIVPAGLVSVPVGLAAAVLATLGHALLLGLEYGTQASTFLSFPFLAPTFLFFLVAQQSFVYGAHLRAKNAALKALAQRLEQSQSRLAEEGRLAAGLAEIARTLSSSLDSPAPLTQVACTIRERLWAEWCAMFSVDEAATFRLLAVSDREVAASDVHRIEFPLGSWPAIERLRHERALALVEKEVVSVPSSLTGQPLRAALLAGLFRNQDMVGFLAVGYRAPLGGTEGWATNLLAGIAEHASVVLQNARLLEEVRAASALKSEFVGAVSHELRSPLNIVLGYVEMLLDEALGPLTEEQRDALDRTNVHAQTLLEMIEALLDLNRMDAGLLPLERIRVPLAALLEDVCEQARRTVERPAVELRCTVEPGLEPIETDPAKLKTIVRNLVHNALKFTSEGHVTVAARHAATGEIAIVVEDTGCGIPTDALGYVFEMFRQVPGSGGGGVGLGLHIVRRLGEAIGARVDVSSEVGTGTRFTVILPERMGASQAAPGGGSAAVTRAA